LERVDLDLEKTFKATVTWGRPPHTAVGEHAMPPLQCGILKVVTRRVVLAYLTHCIQEEKRGYVQGMDGVAATLLQILPEDDAFFTLAALYEDMIPELTALDGSQYTTRTHAVLEEMLHFECPAAVRHCSGLKAGTTNVFEQLNTYLPNEVIARLFTGLLPIETQLRVWDLLFVEGPVTLLCSVVAVFQQAQAQILESKSMIQMTKVLHDVMANLHDADAFVAQTVRIERATAHL
jgi:small G protein signaling modulator 3